MITLQKKIVRSRKDRKKANATAEPSSRSFEIIGVVLVAFGIFSLCGLAGFNVGFVGSAFAKFLNYFFGMGAAVSAFSLIYIGFKSITKHELIPDKKKFAAAVAMFVSLLAIFHHFMIPPGEEILPESLAIGGGLLGGGVLFGLRKLVGVDGGIIVLGAGVVTSILICTTWSLAKGWLTTKKQAEKGVDVAKETAGIVYEKAKVVESRLQERVADQMQQLQESMRRQDSHSKFYDQDKDKAFDEMVEAKQDASQARPSKAEDKPAARSFPFDDDFPFSGEVEENVWGISSDLSSTQEKLSSLNDDMTVPGDNELAGTAVLSSIGKETANKEEKLDIEAAGIEKTEVGMAEKPDGSFTISFGNDSEADVDDFEDEEAADEADSWLDDDDEFPEEEELLAAGSIGSTVTQTATNAINGNPAPAAPAVKETEKPALPPIPYKVPDFREILGKSQKSSNGSLESEIHEKARILAETLENFKVKATIINAVHGPAVTRFEIKPAPGVKVSKITSLADDIALSLAASAVRIEQVPNKAAIGIEVPNAELESVCLREVLEKPGFAEAKSKLTIGWGKDISGQAVFGDISKLYHLLVAGATGSGKSVCINTIVTSILFKAKPDEVKFIMIDPKMVELSVYNDIPHLMVPVVTDAKKAASVLNWAVQEMEKRYGMIADTGVRNIAGYNKLFKDEPEKRLPSLVIIIDELADLMMVAAHEVEDAICRLAQKARAAGIYLILATQRPSVNVITGVIKANIPSRISFAVAQYQDSRCILDASGAEKLLGKGDMLYYPMGSPKPVRVQGAFVSDQEVEQLVEHIKSQGVEAVTNQEIIDFTNASEKEADADNGEKKVKRYKSDAILRDVVDLAFKKGKCSAEFIRRKLHVNSITAAEAIETLESLRIISERDGNKPRTLVVTLETAYNLLDEYDKKFE
ncbi:MAG: DNA translocase FtsK 4TM domain-containing protein [Selenomonadaceae bacterium]|nr:DNA translocase FtsK 4TM domain-containing protein [Selenomonadaceae bacterium]